jgi:hypothetical protein
MEANPLRRVLAAKARLFVGLTMLMAVAVLGIISAFSAAQSPTGTATPTTRSRLLGRRKRWSPKRLSMRTDRYP